MIVTFYSYKGGVGRSMALANVADSLARAGLGVLMIDFDLEAPGLEQYFSVDHARVRGHRGLLDLLLDYKSAMAEEIGYEEDAAFRRINEEFIVPIYAELPAGGRLHLMPAGRREGEEHLARYAMELRRFDWQDFYFRWAGAAFFEWLRRSLVPKLYDVVLVDSRTGVTEMGGICVLQLADTMVMLCAPNRQNLDGTLRVAENFDSDRAKQLRRSRKLSLAVVPARVEQHEPERLRTFRKDFEDAFSRWTPKVLKAEGRSFWDLLIPYDPALAFNEQILSGPAQRGARQQVAAAYKGLVDLIMSLAEPGTKLARLRGEHAAPVEPEYDPTRRFARYDAFFSYHREDAPLVQALGEELRRSYGIRVWLDVEMLEDGARWEAEFTQALAETRAFVVLIGKANLSTFMEEEIVLAHKARADNKPMPIIPVLLEGADPNSIPRTFVERVWLDVRAVTDIKELAARLSRALEPNKPRVPRVTVAIRNPYPGLRPYSEADAPFFFGREAISEHVIRHLADQRAVLIVGSAGSGKSSLVQAGVLPALRAKEGSVTLTLRFGPDVSEALAMAMLSLLPSDAEGVQKQIREQLEDEGDVSGALRTLRASGRAPKERIVLFVDQLEELLTTDSTRAVRLLDGLLAAVDKPDLDVAVLFTLRADSLALALELPGLAKLSRSNFVVLSPPSTSELRAAIELPARVAGVAFEPGLVERIIADFAGEPSSLILMQMLLYQLWERHSEGRITHMDYESLGGLHALGNFADRAIVELSEEDRVVVRSILPQLVSIRRDSAPARRIVAERALALDSPRARNVIERLTFMGLLQLSEKNGERYVELAHEALLHECQILARWLMEDRETLVALDALRVAAQLWRDSRHDRSALLTGSLLKHALALTAERNDLGPAERAFLAACKQRHIFDFVQRVSVLLLVALLVAISTFQNSCRVPQ